METKRTYEEVVRSIRLSLEKEDELDLADSRQRQLAFYLSIARDLASELALDISLRQARNVAYERASDLTSDLANAYTRVLSGEVDEYLILDLAMAMGLALYLEDTLNPELNLADFLTVSRDLVQLLTRDAASVDEYIHKLDRSLDLKANHVNVENASGTGLNVGRLIVKSIILLREAPEISAPFALRLIFTDPQNPALTPSYLSTTLAPYIDALIQIQRISDEIRGCESTPIEILAIRHGSVAVDLTGGIRDTVELILDNIIPWRRQNHRQLAELDVTAKEIELKQKEAEVERARATIDAEAEQANAVAEKAQAEADLLQQQARQLALENKKTELELLDLTLAMVDRIQSGLPDNERFYYAAQLIDPTRFIATSPLELAAVKPLATRRPEDVDAIDEEE